MKFFKTIKNKKVSVEDVVKAVLELEEEIKKTHSALDKVRDRVFDLHSAGLEGAGDEDELRKSEMEVINLQSKSETLARLKDESKNLISEKHRENCTKRREDISKSLEGIKVAKRENSLNIPAVQARVSVLEWYQTGRAIQAPPHVDPKERDHFYAEVDNIKKELGFSHDTKPLDVQKTELLNKLNQVGARVIDPDYIEGFINRSRAESEVAN